MPRSEKTTSQDLACDLDWTHVSLCRNLSVTKYFDRICASYVIEHIIHNQAGMLPDRRGINAEIGKLPVEKGAASRFATNSNRVLPALLLRLRDERQQRSIIEPFIDCLSVSS